MAYQRIIRAAFGVVTVVATAVVLAGCGGSGNERREPHGGTINVAIVDTPNTQDLARLTPSLFTKATGVKVNYTILDEGTLREVVTRDVPSGHRQFDAVMIGPYEAPPFGHDGYIRDLTKMAESDHGYDLPDVFSTLRDALSYHGTLYALPFYGESSFLMFRRDVLDAAGIQMPPHPTWEQVAAIAREVDTPDRAGICLRGKAGWGELGATFTTMLNTFGGTWWAAKPDGSVGRAMVDQPEFRTTLQFYVDLVRDAGEKNAIGTTFNECLALYLAGKTTMWYDATVAAGLIDASDSAVRGKNGYVPAPVERTRASGWLWSWAFAIPKSTPKANLAWKYIAWATSKQYIRQAGPRIAGGWAAIPPGTRRSTYELPEYRTVSRAFAKPALDAIESAPINDPG
ncbi:MAG TPA: extracellular solute-binding protein, partial [Thermoleophilaceae bacterium]|nr:extracellular solute-binding protein [Thermoleophilaceae bacterium]